MCRQGFSGWSSQVQPGSAEPLHTEHSSRSVVEGKVTEKALFAHSLVRRVPRASPRFGEARKRVSRGVGASAKRRQPGRATLLRLSAMALAIKPETSARLLGTIIVLFFCAS